MVTCPRRGCLVLHACTCVWGLHGLVVLVVWILGSFHSTRSPITFVSHFSIPRFHFSRPFILLLNPFRSVFNHVAAPNLRPAWTIHRRRPAVPVAAVVWVLWLTPPSGIFPLSPFFQFLELTESARRSMNLQCIGQLTQPYNRDELHPICYIYQKLGLSPLRLHWVVTCLS